MGAVLSRPHTCKRIQTHIQKRQEGPTELCYTVGLWNWSKQMSDLQQRLIYAPRDHSGTALHDASSWAIYLYIIVVVFVVVVVVLLLVTVVVVWLNIFLYIYIYTNMSCRMCRLSKDASHRSTRFDNVFLANVCAVWESIAHLFTFIDHLVRHIMSWPAYSFFFSLSLSLSLFVSIQVSSSHLQIAANVLTMGTLTVTGGYDDRKMIETQNHPLLFTWLTGRQANCWFVTIKT